MSYELIALDASGGQALYSDGLRCFRLSMENGWVPIPLRDEPDVERCSRCGLFEPTATAYETFENLRDAVRQACLRRAAPPQVTFEDVRHLCPSELLHPAGSPIAVPPQPVEPSIPSVLTALDRWALELQMRLRSHPVRDLQLVFSIEPNFPEGVLHAEARAWSPRLTAEYSSWIRENASWPIRETFWRWALATAQTYCRMTFPEFYPVEAEDIASSAVERLLRPFHLQVPNRPSDRPKRLSTTIQHLVHLECRFAGLQALKRKTSQASITSLSDIADEIAFSEPSPLDLAIASEEEAYVRSRYELVLHAMSQLAPIERRVLELSLFEGSRRRDIAQALELPEPTVSALHQRAIRKLRTLVERYMKD